MHQEPRDKKFNKGYFSGLHFDQAPNMRDPGAALPLSGHGPSRSHEKNKIQSSNKVFFFKDNLLVCRDNVAKLMILFILVTSLLDFI